jgi:hypothetical protein
MKRVEAILAAGLAISLSGCIFHRNTKIAKIAPPPPKPVVAPSPPPLPQPLSIPQTNVQLPPPQPVSPEALATTQPREETPSAPAPVRTPPRRPPVESAPKSVEAAAPPPATVTPPAEERQPIQEVLPPGERQRLSDEADARKRDTLHVLDQVQPQRLTAAQRAIVERVQAFLKQADEAKLRGDVRQADELAGRALVLAKELEP